MTAGRDGALAVAGGPARHIPVLVRRAVELLDVRDGAVYVDATFGGGGYAREILAAADCTVVGIDRDRGAIAHGAGLVEAAGGRLVLYEDRFSNLADVMRTRGIDTVDGVVFDLGVSSMQIDIADRGFSFRNDGPLDMRMGSEGPSAAEVVAAASERDLAAVIATLGEERHARSVARAIVAARRDRPVRTTRALAELVAGVVHARPGALHPATRTFQALRILVNDELAELVAGLMAAEALLKRDGRLVVVAFHSLEDRIVKSFLAARSRPPAASRHRPEARRADATFRVLTRRPVVPDEQEIDANPRARSARLRAAARTAAPAASLDAAGLLPRVPSLAEVLGRRATERGRKVRR
jgi:16S rRNA (cytosine1402-N4)-methyltransferase